MMAKTNSKYLQYFFICITSAMALLSYAILLGGSNLFQWVSAHISYADVYDTQSLKSVCVVVAILSLNLLEHFQKVKYQISLIFLLLVAFLCLHFSLTSYFVLLGIARTLYVLNQAWIQRYAPSEIRTTIAGIVMSLTGLIDLRATMMQSSLDTDIIKGVYIRWALVFFFVLFCLCIRRMGIADVPLKQSRPTPKVKRTIAHFIAIVINRLKLDGGRAVSIIVSNPVIIVAFFLGGLDTTLIYYAYAMAKITLPNNPPEYVQYAIYLGATTLPFITGRFADKLGIFPVFVFNVSMQVLLTFFIGFASLIPLKTPIIYYIAAFLESGLASSLCVLAYSMIGSRIKAENLFRAFTIGLLSNYVGSYLYGFIFYAFSKSFSSIKLITGSINLLGMLLFLYFHFRERKLAR